MARNKQKIRLKDNDWDALFPGEDFKIGSTIIVITPLSLKAIAAVASKLATIGTSISKLGVTVSQIDAELNKEANAILGLVDVVGTILNEAPDILSEMSGLAEEDVQNLPIDVAVKLFTKCLEVNINSQEELVKNLKSLGTKFGQFLNPEIQTPTPATARIKMPGLAS